MHKYNLKRERIPVHDSKKLICEIAVESLPSAVD